MLRLILLGMVAAALFSSTFVLNEMMSQAGGHWLWSASLRYVFMLLFLIIILWLQGGLTQLSSVLALFMLHWRFWLLAGSIGFGGRVSVGCPSKGW